MSLAWQASVIATIPMLRVLRGMHHLIRASLSLTLSDDESTLAIDGPLVTQGQALEVLLHSGPRGTRTPNPRFRRPMLYPLSYWP